jgi:xanthine dehydrogenase accessory factor
MADAQQQWIEELARLRDAGTPCALVTVTNVRGSAPREPGARLIVAEGKLAWGTIGGGNLEHLAIEHALELLADPEPTSESVVYPLSEKAGQCCGGEVTLFYEAWPWRRRHVVVFGAGHVGQALGALAPWLRADVRLIDPRSEDELQPPVPADAPYDVLFVDAPEAEIDELPADACVLVMTHSHALDLEVLVRAIPRRFPYLGLIGSERKWARFRARLAQRGFTDEDLATVRCPIGLARTSKEPRAIAVSTAAELLEVLEAADARTPARS